MYQNHNKEADSIFSNFATMELQGNEDNRGSYQFPNNSQERYNLSRRTIRNQNKMFGPLHLSSMPQATNHSDQIQLVGTMRQPADDYLLGKRFQLIPGQFRHVQSLPLDVKKPDQKLQKLILEKRQHEKLQAELGKIEQKLEKVEQEMEQMQQEQLGRGLLASVPENNVLQIPIPQCKTDQPKSANPIPPSETPILRSLLEKPLKEQKDKQRKQEEERHGFLHYNPYYQQDEKPEKNYLEEFLKLREYMDVVEEQQYRSEEKYLQEEEIDWFAKANAQPKTTTNILTRMTVTAVMTAPRVATETSSATRTLTTASVAPQLHQDQDWNLIEQQRAREQFFLKIQQELQRQKEQQQCQKEHQYKL